MMVPNPTASEMVGPLEFDSVTVKVSLPSATVSGVMATFTFMLVTPGAKLKVPDLP